MPPKHRRNRPSAKTKVRKVDQDLLSSQFSQSQISTQSQKFPTVQRTPQRRNKAPKSLVKQHQTILSPKKKDDEIEDELEEYESDESDNDVHDENVDSEESIIEIESSSDEEPSIKKQKKSDDENTVNNTIKPLTTYKTPLNTRNWVPLTEGSHAELSTLLHLLIPPSLDDMDSSYTKLLKNDIIRPLSNKFSTIYLPPIHKYSSKRVTRSSGDFNINLLYQEQKRLLSSYDINTKQLDTLTLQLLKEKEMVATERKYRNQLREKVNRWKQNKQKRIERLKNNLGDSFNDLKNSLDSKNSGVDGADDLDMVEDSEIESENEINNTDDSKDDHVVELLTKLNGQIDDISSFTQGKRKFDVSIKQLLNQLQK